MFSGNADISLNVAALAVSALSSFIVEDLVKGPRTPMLSSNKILLASVGSRCMSEQRELSVDI